MRIQERLQAKIAGKIIRTVIPKGASDGRKLENGKISQLKCIFESTNGSRSKVIVMM